MEMGFEESKVKLALATASNDHDMAMEILLASAQLRSLSPPFSPPPVPPPLNPILDATPIHEKQSHEKSITLRVTVPATAETGSVLTFVGPGGRYFSARIPEYLTAAIIAEGSASFCVHVPPQTTKGVVAGAAAIGMVVGIVIGGPILALVGLIGGACVAKSAGKSGDAVRSAGAAVREATSNSKVCRAAQAKIHNIDTNYSISKRAGVAAQKTSEKASALSTKYNLSEKISRIKDRVLRRNKYAANKSTSAAAGDCRDAVAVRGVAVAVADTGNIAQPLHQPLMK
jgi:hypothetical protein